MILILLHLIIKINIIVSNFSNGDITTHFSNFVLVILN